MSGLFEVFARRHSGVFLENAGEIAVILEADFPCNLHQRVSPVPDDGIPDAVFVYVLQKRHSQILLEQLAEVAFVVAQIGCDFFGGQICAEVLLYIHLDGMDELDSSLYGVPTFENRDFTQKGAQQTGDSTDMKAFAADKSLLVTTRIGDVIWKLSEMENDYGILPYPLLDESQTEYGTRVQDTMNLMCIPIDAKSAELSGAVLEALAAQSYRTVTPAFFDIALKSRYSRDPETAEMMDLIKDSILINFESLYNECIGYPWTVLRSMMPQKSNNFSSYWASCEKLIKAKLSVAVRFIQKLE